ncbi:sister chromatid cohesion 1 protein 1, partial [Tanacetum coccineum]
MFYSHQLLARKAPLGQICEEILNPSVPMALRLSGILMGGVVIVYERKVKLLYEDVTRLLVELNEAWKVKVKRDPTVLPKGKTRAKYEAVTLQDDQMSDLNELEQTLLFSNSDTLMGIHKTDIDNITICDKFDSYHADPNLFNQFERFDMEGDDIGVTGEKFPSHTHTDPPPDNFVPSPPLQDVPSPPLQDVPQNPDEIPEKHPGDQANPQSDEDKVLRTPKIQRPPRRRGRRGPATLMDYEQTMIPGQMYQSWLQDTSDIVSGRGKKRKHMGGNIRSIKIARLMDLPPVSLVCGLVTNGTPDIYYPLPLLQQWMKITEAVHDSPSGGASPPHPPAPSSSTSPPAPPVTNNHDDPTTVPFEDHHSGVASGSSVSSIRKFRAERSTGILRRELETDLMNNGINVTEANGRTGPEADLIVTPGNS